jgi:hypothetical protein
MRAYGLQNTAWRDPPAAFDDGDMSLYVYKSLIGGELRAILLCADAILLSPRKLTGGSYTSAANEAALRTLMTQERTKAWGG